MRLFLSFSGLAKYWRNGTVDWNRDLFFFGCGRPHVMGEPGTDKDGPARPWSEWLKWGSKATVEECREVREILERAETEGRVGFAKDMGFDVGQCHSQIAEMLKRFDVEPPKVPEEWELYCHYGYPSVATWLEGTVECLY